VKSHDPKQAEAFESMIGRVLAQDDAKLLIEQAKAKLLDDAERHAFNTERAKEVFQMAIERAIWKNMGSTTGAATTRALRGEGIVEAFAQRYTDEFKGLLRISDQRPARRGLLAKFIGR
jgi:hypothetical protein